MAQSGSGYSYRPGMIPSAPPLLGPSVNDDVAPPSYEEAIQAPSKMWWSEITCEIWNQTADVDIIASLNFVFFVLTLV